MEEVDTEEVLVAAVVGKEVADLEAVDSEVADMEAVLAVVGGKEAADMEEADTEAVLAAAVVRLHILYIIWLIIALCSCIISVVDRAVKVFCVLTPS
jgi:hypothetical protein